jgi:WD40 repeat protein
LEHQKNEQPHSQRAKLEAGTIPSLLSLRGHFAFSPPSPEPERQFSPLDGIRQVFSLTDEHLLLFFQQHATLLNIHDQEILWTLTWPPSIHAVLFRDGIFVLAGSRSLFLWNMLTDQLIQTFHPMRYLPAVEENGKTFSPDARSFLDFFRDISMSRDGSLMALALGWSGAAQLWNVITGQYLYMLEPEEEYSTGNSVAMSPDGQIIATGNWEEGDVSVWRATDGQFVTRLSGEGRVGELVFSPDGHILAYGDGSGGNPKAALHAWDTRIWQPIPDLAPNAGALAFSNDGKLLAIVPKNHHSSLDIVDVSTRKTLRRFQDSFMGWPVGFCSNTSLLISTNRAMVRWWNLHNQQEVYRLEISNNLKANAQVGSAKIWYLDDQKLSEW